MALYLALSMLVPKIVKKPTGIKVVDDLVMYLVAQKGFLVSGVILFGLVVYFTNYINERMLE